MQLKRRKVLTAVFSAALFAAPLFAGALMLEVADPQTNPEALAKHAVVLARVSACSSPEKTVVSATAEGIVDGHRKTLPLKPIKLATPGWYAVTREWPDDGVWSVRIVVTHPDYKNYATGAVVPVQKDTYVRAGAKQFYRAPTDADVDAALKQATLD